MPNGEGVAMASSNDAYDAYTSGAMDAVKLINENEGKAYSVRDVINALEIKRILNEVASEYEGE